MTAKLEEIRGRLEKITQPPWESRGPMGYDFEFEVRTEDAEPRNKHYWPMRICQTIKGQRSDADAANFDFIANAPTDVRWLVDEVDRLSARVGELEAEVAWLHNKPIHYCDSKCDYGKTGDPAGCSCGYVQWIEEKPAHLRRAAALAGSEG